jgi:hypothetical protein
MNENIETNELRPQNILMKISWAESIKLLNNKERSDILINIFNFHTGDELVKMTKASSLFFASAVDTFNYNIQKYQQKVETNRKNGLGGGRPKKQNNPKNPTGSSGIPENPKEKEREIGKEKNIEIKNYINEIEREKKFRDNQKLIKN